MGSRPVLGSEGELDGVSRSRLEGVDAISSPLAYCAKRNPVKSRRDTSESWLVFVYVIVRALRTDPETVYFILQALNDGDH